MSCPSACTASSQTFPSTSTVTAVNLECGTRPGRRNSKRELLTFFQSHDEEGVGGARAGHGNHGRINYIYNNNKKKQTFLFVFHIASTCMKQTSKRTPTHEHGEIGTRRRFLEIHLKNNNSKKVWFIVRTVGKTHCWSESVEPKLFRFGCLIAGLVSGSESSAWWKPASEQTK